nr:uncharacterized protein CTRU02_11656 [Colletotrichum truncatum]KAF6785671.1 hypothetical protein CTRU02_11656 [Colletotrichum truncatum]
MLLLGGTKLSSIDTHRRWTADADYILVRFIPGFI